MTTDRDLDRMELILVELGRLVAVGCRRDFSAEERRALADLLDTLQEVRMALAREIAARTPDEAVMVRALLGKQPPADA